MKVTGKLKKLPRYVYRINMVLNYSNSTKGWSVAITSPSLTRKRLIVPSMSVARSFSIFIAS